MEHRTNQKIITYKDLEVWKEGHKLVLMIYKTTKLFPNDERFGIIDQMRRASVSITSNIAEGFTRFGLKEKTQFYYISKGSLVELDNQVTISKDIGYISSENFQLIDAQINKVGKILTGLIRSTKK
jgi:four helix bundle protein